MLRKINQSLLRKGTSADPDCSKQLITCIELPISFRSINFYIKQSTFFLIQAFNIRYDRNKF